MSNRATAKVTHDAQREELLRVMRHIEARWFAAATVVAGPDPDFKAAYAAAGLPTAEVVAVLVTGDGPRSGIWLVAADGSARRPPPVDEARTAVQAAHTARVVEALVEESGSVARAAVALGMPVRALHQRIHETGLRDWLTETYPLSARQPA